MSHDIRTPLNAVLNLITLMRSEITNPVEIGADLDKVEMSANYLLQLINEVLDMTRIESGRMEMQPEVYPYSEFMEYIDSVVLPMCSSKDITFQVERANPDYDIYVDKLRFNQIFMNLISNAVKYTDNGGEVSLLVHNSKIENGILYSDFVVKDNGRGMSEAFQKKLFIPFERENTTGAYGGTGLGLAITKSIVEAMGGSIEIESRLGEGTAVTVHLSAPVATREQLLAYRRKKAGSLKNEADKAENDSCRGRRVLVVEDHLLNQEIVKRILEQFGMVTRCVSDGAEAVRAFSESEEGYFDIILMDIRMPVMDGYEATRTIRRLKRADGAEVPVIAMTAEAFGTDVEKALAEGMNDHLAKPINPRKLHQVLCYHLQEKSRKSQLKTE